MPVLGYLEALDRFGLQELKQGDLQIKDCNIAVTADGGDYESGSSVFAGATLLVLNNLLQRCKKDLGAADTQWDSANPKINGYSIGVVFAAAAANFRHHDEWARLRNLDDRRRASMEPLRAVLGYNLLTQGHPTIQTNVCRDILIAISGESVDRLYKLTFDYANALAA